MSVFQGLKGARRLPRDQRGTALIEFMVALVVLSITLGGIAAATMTAGTIGKNANDAARMNVVMTAFGEAIKAVPYKNCASSLDYQESFDNSEADDDDVLSASGAELTVVDVEAGSTCPPDSGVQTITLNVKLRGEELTRDVVKRNPRLDAPLDFCIYSPVPRIELAPSEQAKACPDDDDTLHPIPGEPSVIWGLKAGGESQIVQREWWCGSPDDAGPPPDSRPPDHIETAGSLPPECRYDAVPEGAPPETRTIWLRVTEDGSLRTGVMSLEVPLATAEVGVDRLLAQITVVSLPDCTSLTPCSPEVPISFRSTGPPPAGTSIVRWEWDFGDGTPPTVCTTTPGDPTGSSCVNRTYSYLGGGEFQVRLRVTDTRGAAYRSDWASRPVTVQGDPVVRPTVEATSNLSGTPAYGVSPQTVTFDASGSHADGYPAGVGMAAGIVNYYWEFGPSGAIQSGPNLANPTFLYPASSKQENFEVRVTVTDHQGLTNFATMTVKLDPLVPPKDLINRGARKGDIWFFQNAHFDFQWTNVARTPGDTITTVIKIVSSSGICGSLGLGVNYREFSVVSNPAPSVQTYRAQFSSSPRGFNGVCNLPGETFTYSGKTVRTNSSGTYESGWGPSRLLDPEF